MSATLGTVLKELEPTLNVVMFEWLHDCAQESSEAWNNAGTGHAGSDLTKDADACRDIRAKTAAVLGLVNV
jgi:L-2-hydroxyglutarate oxidase LhgO